MGLGGAVRMRRPAPPARAALRAAAAAAMRGEEGSAGRCGAVWGWGRGGAPRVPAPPARCGVPSSRAAQSPPSPWGRPQPLRALKAAVRRPRCPRAVTPQ